MNPNYDQLSKSTFKPTTLTEILRWRALNQPNRYIYTYLVDGETEEISLTYKELDKQARAIGAKLQSLGKIGERALLVYPPGLEFIAAFLGCLYSGLIAVPVYPPHPARLDRTMPKFLAIANDAKPLILLTTSSMLARLEGLFTQVPDFETIGWLTTDKIEEELAEIWQNPGINSDTLAFLQYTSGSTTTPRGVMVSHGNMMHNLALIQRCFEHTQDSRGVIWLPPYHDMGLIGGILQPLYSGFPVTLMSPVVFLQRPFRWLQAISRFRATTSGGPNFAYDLCVQRITPQQRETLDLSSWDVAFNGAEPICHETLDRFAAYFEPAGFRREAFYPCYGLAEATLIVSGGAKAAPPIIPGFQSAALEQDKVVADIVKKEGTQILVGCGQTLEGQEIIIVDPNSLTRCPPDQVGEIWVSGPSVTKGYWNRADETKFTFQALLADTNEGPFLRTGDLGFLMDGELYVTGRLKDLIIIDGSNFYPQDIEWTVERSHPALRKGSSAAFSVNVAGKEQLVAAAEVDRRYQLKNIRNDKPELDTKVIIGAIEDAVAANHDLGIYDILLLKQGTIPKTQNGKIQRHACRLGYLAGSLNVLTKYKGREYDMKIETKAFNSGNSFNEQVGLNKESRSAKDIQNWLISKLSKHVGIEPEEIDIHDPFTRYGISSKEAKILSGDMEVWLGSRLSPTLLYEYPNIKAIAQHLAAGPGHPEVKSKVNKIQKIEEEPIAIIGIGCRFPGASGPEAFWRLLRDGVDAVTEVPPDRWDSEFFYNPDVEAPGKMNTRWGGFLEQVDQFDPHFFGISPREAARMDPQQRLLLEVTWEALEDAGQAAERLAETETGVFVGISSNDYSRIQVSDHRLIDAYAGTGNALSIAANRISYLFNFRGPSIAVDTACSSSLVAVHLACRSIFSGESTLALAGGVNLILSPEITINFSKAGVMAPDGRSKAFDARANGYTRSEGAGMVVLKPLANALADGDPVYAVILGGAVNQDGRTNGIMAPSRQAQEEVLQRTYKSAGVSPGEVQYVETHGIGTLLGDSIEAKALGNVFAIDRVPGRHCLIGSVKTNIGHLEAAAGIASLIKVALSLKYQMIPPSLHFQKANPHIPFDDLPLRVQKTLSPYPEKPGLSVAGVSAFGFGGTNAHMVLREAPKIPGIYENGEEPGNEWAHLLPLSAHSPEALQSLVRLYQEFFDAKKSSGDDVSLKNVCYTASLRRSFHDFRLGLVGRTREELIEQLGGFLQGETRANMSSDRILSGLRRKLVFVFPGQDSQWFGMGRKPLKQEPVFRETLEQCDRALQRHADWSLLEELTGAQKRSRLEEIDVIQPTLFAVQVALTALWRSWGIEPDAVVGYSMGEVAAAHTAGALTLEDAVRIITRKSQWLKRPQMDSLRTDLLQELEGIQPRPSSLPIYSTVTGMVSEGVRFDADYWVRKPGEPVLFSKAVQQLLENGHDIFLEISPHPLLLSAISQCLHNHDREGAVLPSLRREEDERSVMLGSLGALYTMGIPIDWGKLYPLGGRYVRLPSYPWQRERCWLEHRGMKSSRFPMRSYVRGDERNMHPFLGQYLDLADNKDKYFWEMNLGTDLFPYLDEHRVLGEAVLPMAAYMEMALAASEKAFGPGPHVLEKVVFKKALFLPEQGTQTVQLIISLEMPGTASFRFFSLQGGDTERQPVWTLHTAGTIRLGQADTEALPGKHISHEKIQSRCSEVITGAAHYQAMEERGIQYGPSFRGVEQIWRQDGEAVGRLRFSKTAAFEADDYKVHPAFLDACFQVLAAAQSTKNTDIAKGQLFVPVNLHCFRVFNRPRSDIPLWSCALLRPGTEDNLDYLEGDVFLLDENGEVKLGASGLRLQRLDSVNGRPAKGRLTRAALLAAEPQERHCLLETHLRQQVAGVLGLPVSKLDPRQPLNNLGIDSLMAVEIRNRIEGDLGVTLPLAKFLRGPNIAQLAARVLEQLAGTTPSPSPSPPSLSTLSQDGPEKTDQLMEKLNELPETEIDALLRDMLALKDDNQ